MMQADVKQLNNNEFISLKTAIWFGIAGVLGGLVLFAGDMLFYYNGAEQDLMKNMSLASDQRIIASTVTALIAAWLYTLGSGQIYYAFQPAKKWVRLVLFFSFSSIMITYGVVHGAYVAIATSAKISVEMGLQPGALTTLAVEANDMLRNIAFVPFGIFTVLFIPTVWMKLSHYPRWMIVFCPVIPFLLSDVIIGSLQGELKVIIYGGFLNLILVLFFTASTIALYRKNPT